MNRRWYYLSLLFLLGGILLRQPLLVVSAVLLFLILATIDIWANYCFRNLHYQRRLSEKQALFGEEITLSLSVENAKLLPLPWLEIADAMPSGLPIRGQPARPSLRDNIMELECLFSPNWYERVTRQYTLLCNKRGVHAFGPTKLRSGDIFGFITREMQLPERQYLLVYPLVVPLTSFGLPARHPFGERRAPRRLLEDPSRVVGVRDYVYGDSLRRVNWKASARTMTLQSKVYEATTTHTIVLFLDIVTRLDIYYGIHPELQELAICAAASVTDWAITQGYAVGLYANTMMSLPDEEISPEMISQQENFNTVVTSQMKRRRIRMPPASSEEQRKRIMEMLARTQPYFGTSIEKTIADERAHLPTGSTVLVITDSVGETLVDALMRMRQNGHAVTLLFVGDTQPPMRLGGLSIYHLGGTQAWKDLEAAYSRPLEEETAEKARSVQAAPTFRL